VPYGAWGDLVGCSDLVGCGASEAFERPFSEGAGGSGVVSSGHGCAPLSVLVVGGPPIGRGGRPEGGHAPTPFVSAWEEGSRCSWCECGRVWWSLPVLPRRPRSRARRVCLGPKGKPPPATAGA